MAEIRLIVAGGRDFSDTSLLEREVSDKIILLSQKYNMIDIVAVSGHCRGTDMLWEKFANECEFPIKTFPAEWEKDGRAAGPMRNRKMAEYASEGDNIGVLIAFWDGKSKGTKSMIDYGLKHLHEVHVIKY